MNFSRCSFGRPLLALLLLASCSRERVVETAGQNISVTEAIEMLRSATEAERRLGSYQITRKFEVERGVVETHVTAVKFFPDGKRMLETTTLTYNGNSRQWIDLTAADGRWVLGKEVAIRTVDNALAIKNAVLADDPDSELAPTSYTRSKIALPDSPREILRLVGHYGKKTQRLLAEKAYELYKSKGISAAQIADLVPMERVYDIDQATGVICRVLVLNRRGKVIDDSHFTTIEACVHPDGQFEIPPHFTRMYPGTKLEFDALVRSYGTTDQIQNKQTTGDRSK